VTKYLSFRDFDWVLLSVVLMICGIGIVEIYTSTMSTKFAASQLHIKQMYWVLAGLAVMFIVSIINYEMLLENVHWFYIASIVALELAALAAVRDNLTLNVWMFLFPTDAIRAWQSG